MRTGPIGDSSTVGTEEDVTIERSQEDEPFEESLMNCLRDEIDPTKNLLCDDEANS